VLVVVIFSVTTFILCDHTIHKKYDGTVLWIKRKYDQKEVFHVLVVPGSVIKKVDGGLRLTSHVTTY